MTYRPPTRTLRHIALRALLDGDEETWKRLLEAAERVEQKEAERAC